MQDNGKNDILDAFRNGTNLINMLVPYGLKTTGTTDWLAEPLMITWNPAANGVIDFANDNSLITITQAGQVRGFRVVTGAAFSNTLPAYGADVGIEMDPIDYTTVEVGDKLKILETTLGATS